MNLKSPDSKSYRYLHLHYYSTASSKSFLITTDPTSCFLLPFLFSFLPSFPPSPFPIPLPLFPQNSFSNLSVPFKRPASNFPSIPPHPSVQCSCLCVSPVPCQTGSSLKESLTPHTHPSCKASLCVAQFKGVFVHCLLIVLQPSVRMCRLTPLIQN